MVQHAATIDVVEGFAEIRQVGDRPLMKRDVGQPAHLGAGARHSLGRRAEVEVINPPAGHPVRQMLRQHDRGIAGAAAGDQGAKRFRQIQATGADIVVDLVKLAG